MPDFTCEYCVGTLSTPLRQAVFSALNQAGFRSCGSAENIPSLLRLVRYVQPGLIVIDTELPPGNLAALAEIIEKDCLCAALYIKTGKGAPAGFTSLDYPFSSEVLTAVAKAVCLEFAHKKRMHTKIASLKQKFIEQKTIDRAKLVLINRYGISEEKAFRLLQKTSMEQRVPLAETARRAINSPAAFSARSPLE